MKEYNNGRNRKSFVSGEENSKFNKKGREHVNVKSENEKSGRSGSGNGKGRHSEGRNEVKSGISGSDRKVRKSASHKSDTPQRNGADKGYMSQKNSADKRNVPQKSSADKGYASQKNGADKRNVPQRNGGYKRNFQQKNTVNKKSDIQNGNKTVKNYACGDKTAENIAEKTGSRLCEVSGWCGGCQLLDYPYEKQLELKQKSVQKLIGKFVKVDRIIGMENPYHYRNKVHAVLDVERGKIVSGVYEAGTHNVVPVKQCLIENALADRIIQTIVSLMPSFKIKAYSEDTGYGYLRHILVRVGHVTGQVMVVLVAADTIFPSKKNFIKVLRERHPEITTVVLNVNYKDTNMVLGDREVVLYGRGYIEDELCGRRFIISPKSFYQVNPVQTEVLYKKAIEFAGLTGKERVIDAYCGIGTIGISAADKAGEVIGVELNPDAVRDAVKNAKLNNIKNISFYKNDASDFMQGMAAGGEKVDVVIMDPPRSGSDERFINAVVALAPGKVVYISCSPETQARDLEYFSRQGYKAVKAVPVDMFAMTEHVETVCLLSNRKSKPDSYVDLSINMEDYHRIKNEEK